MLQLWQIISLLNALDVCRYNPLMNLYSDMISDEIMVMDANLIFHHHYLSEEFDSERWLCFENNQLIKMHLMKVFLLELKVFWSLISTHLDGKSHIIKESSEFDDSSVIRKKMMRWFQIHLNHQALTFHWGEIANARFRILHNRFLFNGWSEIDGNSTDRFGLKSCI